jgi:Fibronectin type III domain.
LVLSVVLGSVAGTSLVAGATGLDPSNVVLVFDVSNSILLSTDGTNVEFADALNGVADRVKVVAADLAAGNAEVSFVVFGRTAVPYSTNCARLHLRDDPAAIARFEQCLRSIAAEYRAGAKAPVRQRINTQDTDHVAALVEAASLLPATSTRSAVIFFTDGKNDPPGTARDHEDVVARATPAFAGKTPLAVLPVGLGAGAGAFETELTAIYQAFFRDMEPCEGRASFSWPNVVFPSADAGTAVALALQEVTCSFTVAPTPAPSLVPTQPPASFAPPTGVRVLAGNGFLTIQWLPPSTGAEAVTDYLVQCRGPSGGEPIESQEGVSTALETKISGLQPGSAYVCEVAATDGITIGPWSAPSASTVVLGIPSAPAQPRVEPLDASARLSMDPPGTVGIPVEQYLVACTDGAGRTVQVAGPPPSVVVTGLANGETYQCVVYAENSVGRSPASPPSVSFSPCSGLFDCDPWAKFALAGLVLTALLGAGAVVAQRYRRRSRVWSRPRSTAGRTGRSVGGPSSASDWSKRRRDGSRSRSRPRGPPSGCGSNARTAS